MAIAWVDQDRTGANGSGNRTASNIAINSGDVLVGAALAGDGDYCTDIRWNGTSMTFIDKQKHNASGPEWTYLYFMGNPDTGTHDLEAVFSSGSNYKSVLGSTYSGAKTTTPTNKTKGTATASSIGLSLTYAGGWGVEIGCINAGGAITSVTNGTQRTASGQNDALIDTNSTNSGSYTITISSTSGAWSSGIIMELETASTTAVKTYNGLAYASTKTVNGLAVASVKTKNGLA